MKAHKITYLILSAVVLFTACKDESARHSIPVIKSLTLSRTESMLIPDTIYIDAQVSDNITPLSTLEVELIAHNTLINSRSIRTKGNEATLEREAFHVPFAPGIETNDELTFRFTFINVDGNEAVQEIKLNAIRPALPETLYLITSEEVIELKKSDDKPHIYQTGEGEFKSSYTGKLATDEDIEKATFIWNGDSAPNEALIGERFGEDISINFPTWLVSKISFDALAFDFDVEGEEIILSIKDVQLAGVDGYFFAEIKFTKDEEFSIEGLTQENLLTAYNRDFFSYNEETGKFTFLRETGTWEVYYSLEKNYFWVMRIADTAPACYWITGHGFTSATVWHTDYYWGGWSLDDVDRLGYMVAIGGNKYQASVLLTTDHEWESFEIEIYSKRIWAEEGGKELGILLTESALKGETAGFAISRKTDLEEGEIDLSKGLKNSTGFVPGYYRLTLDTSAGTGEGQATLTIKRLSD